MFVFAAITVQVGCLWLAVSAESLSHLVLAQLGTLVAAGLLIVRTGQRLAVTEARTPGTVDNQHADDLDDEVARLLIAGAFSAVAFLLAVVLLLALTGSLNLAEIQTTLRNSYRPDHADMIVGTESRLGVAAIVLLFAATGLQTALPPFQVTICKVIDHCPARTAGLIAILQRLHAAVLIWRLGVLTLVGFESTVQIVALVSGVASAVIGTAIVCRTESLRGLASGFWTISAATIFLTLAVGVTSPLSHLSGEKWQLPDGLETAALAIATSCTAFLLLMLCERCTSPATRRVDFCEDLTGLGRQRPVIATALAVSLLTFCAVPPLPGFWVFGFLAAGVFVPGLTDRSLVPNAAILLTLAIVGVSLLTAATRAIHMLSLVFLHEPLSRSRSSASRLDFIFAVAIALLLLWAGLIPRAILDQLHQLLT